MNTKEFKDIEDARKTHLESRALNLFGAKNNNNNIPTGAKVNSQSDIGVGIKKGKDMSKFW